MTEVQLARTSMAVDIVVAEEDGDKGIVEAIVSAYNVKYRMGFFEHHTIKPGTFAESIAEQPAIPLFWMHNWDWTEQPPIGTAEASEVEKPKQGLKIAGEMWLDEPGARPVFRALKAKAIREWSIGYRILASEVDDEDDRHVIVTKAELLEASSVLRGANPDTETLKVARLHPGTVRRVAEALGVTPDRLSALVAGIEAHEAGSLLELLDRSGLDPAALYTPNELREREGLPPVEDTAPAAVGDETPAPIDDMEGAAREIKARRNLRRLELTRS